MRKKALITGVAGQDGSYLSEFLLDKGYEVHGVIRRSSLEIKSRIDHLYQGPGKNKYFFPHYGDITDPVNINSLVASIQPDEIYNLAAQSHVRVSFDVPVYTAQTDAIGCLNILEAIKQNGLVEKTRFYQASSSELFGRVNEVPQNENTPFNPLSPYATAKLYAYWITVNYRESYGIFGSNGILFNHESPRRGETFVTKKIIKALVRIKMGYQKQLVLGNLDSKRDWGHARDYVEAMWKILQQKKPNDYVIATGKQHSIRQFINFVAKKLNMKIIWKGTGPFFHQHDVNILDHKRISIFNNNHKTFLNGNGINIFEDGRESRDFVYIDDVVDANIMAVQNSLYHSSIALNVGSGVSTSIHNLIHSLASKLSSLASLTSSPSSGLLLNEKNESIFLSIFPIARSLILSKEIIFEFMISLLTFTWVVLHPSIT